MALHWAFPLLSSGAIPGWRLQRVTAATVTYTQGKPVLSRQRQSQEHLKASLAGLCSEGAARRGNNAVSVISHVQEVVA